MEWPMAPNHSPEILNKNQQNSNPNLTVDYLIDPVLRIWISHAIRALVDPNDVKLI